MGVLEKMTQELTEFYEEKQGRPASRMALDMESRKSPVVSTSAISLAYLSSVIMTYEGTVVINQGKIVYRS